MNTTRTYRGVLAALTLTVASSPAIAGALTQVDEVGPCEVATTYRTILARDAEPAGAAYWATLTDLEALVEAIGTSPEATPMYQADADTWADWSPHLANQIAAICNTERDTIPAGWVDAGHGVYLPPILLEVRQCEWDPVDQYRSRNGHSSASGAWQLIESTARMVARNAGRDDLIGYGDNVAGSWSPVDQDLMALELYRMLGGNVGSTMGWAASAGCWS